MTRGVRRLLRQFCDLRSAILPLWRVDDAAIRRLMEALYDSLWALNMGQSDALWQARQTSLPCALPKS